MLQEPLWLICHNNGTTSTTVLRNVVHLSVFFLIFSYFIVLLPLPFQTLYYYASNQSRCLDHPQVSSRMLVC